MPTNIEIKVKVNDLDAIEKIAQSINAKFIGLINQVDTFFDIPTGKLKLREFSDRPAELIFYDRKGTDKWRSDYIIADISDTKNLKKILSILFDTKVIVSKTRKLYMYETCRIHLDTVENLGTFLELESVIIDDEQKANELFEKLYREFKIHKEDTIRFSYSELLLELSQQ